MPFQQICIVDQSGKYEYENIVGITRQYTLKGFPTRQTAELALLSSPLCPLIEPTATRLIRRSVDVVSKVKIDDEFTANVSWEDYIPPEIDREIISGSVSLVTQNVTNTFRHVGSFGPGNIAPLDAGGLINVTSEGADGVDVEFPILNFSIARLYNKGTFNLAFLANASSFASKPNTTPWRGFGSGTVRLLSVEGSQDTGEDHDEVVFSFQASPTVQNIVIESPLGNIIVPEKLGWQYLHIQSVEHHDPTTGITSFVPHTAHVDEVTEGVDLNELV